MRQTWVDFRLEAADDAFDEAALAGGVPAVDADDDPPAGAHVMDLQVEQAMLQLLELVLVGLLVDRTVDHLDLVQDRPLAHRFLHRRIVPVRAGQGNEPGTLTARTVATTNLANGRR